MVLVAGWSDAGEAGAGRSGNRRLAGAAALSLAVHAALLAAVPLLARGRVPLAVPRDMAVVLTAMVVEVPVAGVTTRLLAPGVTSRAAPAAGQSLTPVPAVELRALSAVPAAGQPAPVSAAPLPPRREGAGGAAAVSKMTYLPISTLPPARLPVREPAMAAAAVMAEALGQLAVAAPPTPVVGLRNGMVPMKIAASAALPYAADGGAASPASPASTALTPPAPPVPFAVTLPAAMAPGTALSAVGAAPAAAGLAGTGGTVRVPVANSDDVRAPAVGASGAASGMAGAGVVGTAGAAPAIDEAELGRPFAPAFARRMQPEYPEVQRRRGCEGSVRLRLAISEQGALEDVEILSSDHPAFTAAALRAVRASAYLPARDRSGRAVAARACLTLHFRLVRR